MYSRIVRFFLLLPLALLSACFDGPSTSEPRAGGGNDEDEDRWLAVQDLVSGASTSSATGRHHPFLTEDGQYLVFTSAASDLVGAGSNGRSQIYILQVATGFLTRVSHAADGSTGNGDSFRPMVSADGKRVVFESDASNLVTNDGNAARDVFLHDLAAGTTTRITGSGGGFHPSISADGSRVTYSSEGQVYLRVLSEAAPILVSQAPGGNAGNEVSGQGRISRNGKRVAFASYASDLVADDTNGKVDIFVRDIVTGTTRRVSVSSSGVQANGNSYEPALSADGTRIAFHSFADELDASVSRYGAHVFLRDLATGLTRAVSKRPDGSLANGEHAAVSADGTRIAFGGESGVTVHGLSDGGSVDASPAVPPHVADGIFSDISLSHAGDFVAFSTNAAYMTADDTDGVTDVFVRDVPAGMTSRAPLVFVEASRGRSSDSPSISEDGNRVVFVSSWPHFVPGESRIMPRVFLRDESTGEITLVSVNDAGEPADGPSRQPVISGDGMHVAFTTSANNLPGTGAGVDDSVQVRNLAAGTTVLASRGVDDTPFSYASSADLSRDGRHVVFLSGPDYGSDNCNRNTLRRDLLTGTTILVNVKPDGTPAAPFGGGSSCLANPSISADGNRIAFVSASTDLVSGMDTTALRYSNVFVRTVSTATTQLVSRHSSGAQVYSDSFQPDISGDGARVAFVSHSNVLVAGDTNGQPDVFLHVLATGVTSRESVASNGSQANGGSGSPRLSHDGSRLAFASDATNLVAGDTNRVADIFLRNPGTGATQRVSTGAAGQADGASANPALAANGQFVAFDSEAGNLTTGTETGSRDVYVREIAVGNTRWTTDITQMESSGISEWPAISQDGRFVAFASSSSNLVRNDTNGLYDIFVHDRATGVISRVNVDTAGNEANGYSANPGISADGRYVVFRSSATNLVANDTNGVADVFVHDRDAGTTTRVSVGNGGAQADAESGSAVISADGRHVAFVSSATNLVADTNGMADVFVRDLSTGTTVRASVGTGGQANGESSAPSINADGSAVAFASYASNLVGGDNNGAQDVFVRDFAAAATERMSRNSAGAEANASSDAPSISADGRRVSFSSGATNLGTADNNGFPDVFLRDRDTNQTRLVSVSSNGTQIGYGWTITGQISGEGDHIVFTTGSGDLVDGDTNGQDDVFVHTPATGVTARASVATGGGQIDDGGSQPALSGNGRFVAFTSRSGSIVPGDTNGYPDVFVHDLMTGVTARVSGF